MFEAIRNMLGKGSEEIPKTCRTTSEDIQNRFGKGSEEIPKTFGKTSE